MSLFEKTLSNSGSLVTLFTIIEKLGSIRKLEKKAVFQEKITRLRSKKKSFLRMHASLNLPA